MQSQSEESTSLPRVVVRPVAVGSAGDDWPEVVLRHGERPTDAAVRAVRTVDGRAVEVLRPVSVDHALVGGVSVLTVELAVQLGTTTRPFASFVAPAVGAVLFRRLAAYAVVLVDGRVLLTQLSKDTPAPGAWTLPGGGIDPGESPLHAVLREVHEETAHELVDPRLLDVDATHFTGRSPSGRLEDFHGIGVIYRAQVREAFEPRVIEVGGSTVAAAWVPLDRLPGVQMSDRSRERLTRVLRLVTA